MTRWRVTTLGDIVDLFDYKRVPLSSSQRACRQGPFPYYGAQGIIDHIDEYIFDGRFILIPEDGENLRSRKLPIAFFANGRFWVNNHAHIVRARPGVANDRFVQAALEATDIGPYVTGAAQPKLSQANLRQIPMLLPPVKQQDIIASIFDAVDDLIENNRRQIGLLEQMAQAIYREWFVRFRYPGHEDAVLVDSPLGPKPESWEVRPFAEIAFFVNGFAFKPEHWGRTGRPIIKIRELKQGVTAATPRCEMQAVAPKYWVEPGDLLFSWSADLGAYRWSYEPALLNQHLFTVIPTRGLSLAFMFRTLEDAMPQFRDRAQGTTMRHIKRAALSEVSTTVPPQSLVDLFTEAVEPMDKQVISVRGSSERLAAIRDLLLPKLVTGQIDVSKVDLDALVDTVA